MMMADSNNQSIRQTALKMWKDGGLAGMFRGNFATILKIIPQTATQFAVRSETSFTAWKPSKISPNDNSFLHVCRYMMDYNRGVLAPLQLINHMLSESCAKC